MWNKLVMLLLTIGGGIGIYYMLNYGERFFKVEIHRDGEIKTEGDINFILNKQKDQFEMIIEKLNLSGCEMFTGEKKIRCIYIIKDSLGFLKSESDCVEFSGSNYYNLCINNMLLKEKKCNLINDKLWREKCKNEYYFDLAAERENKYWCLYIKDKDLKKECLANIERKQKLKKIKEEYNVFCEDKVIGQLAYQPSLKKQLEICEKLKDNEKRYVKCLNQYYFSKAINRLDIKACDNITDKMLKEECKKSAIYFQAIEYTNLKLCDKLDNDKKQECKDKVRLRIITRDRLIDLAECEKIKLPVYKKQCYQAILNNIK